MNELFISISLSQALQVVLLGLIGGVLSGFIGSGGAFFMTPGMMNLGVQGIISVGTNITHKFGKAMVGSKKHGEMGHVDKKLGIFMLITAFIGIRLAVWITSTLFDIKDAHAPTGAAANLYISAVFVIMLAFVSTTMAIDILRKKPEGDTGPSKKISNYLAKLKLSPMIYFPVADVKVSLWILMIMGLFTGYMAGTIGVGGFIGVPAMIYIFGIPTAVATGTELYLAMYMGAFGALNYAYEGFVDIRLVALLYLGSLIGIYIGAYGTKVVKEQVIRITTALIIILCVLSRLIAIPVYLQQLNWIDFIDESHLPIFNTVSKYFLYLSGVGGVGVILYNVIKAYIKKKRVYKTIVTRN